MHAGTSLVVLMDRRPASCWPMFRYSIAIYIYIPFVLAISCSQFDAQFVSKLYLPLINQNSLCCFISFNFIAVHFCWAWWIPLPEILIITHLPGCKSHPAFNASLSAYNYESIALKMLWEHPLNLDSAKCYPINAKKVPLYNLSFLRSKRYKELTLTFLPPIVPKAHNSDCQNLIFPWQIKPINKSQFKVKWQNFIFCTDRERALCVCVRSTKTVEGTQNTLNVQSISTLHPHPLPLANSTSTYGTNRLLDGRELRMLMWILQISKSTKSPFREYL